MSIFGKLFKQSEQKDETAPADPANDPNLIRVYDKYGQEFFISKDEWRKNVLPGAIRSEWNNPDQLYTVIINALNDGFNADVLEAATQLHLIEPDSSRAACLYGIVLMKNQRLDEAEQVLNSFLQEHGNDGFVITNLAKVHAARGEMEKAEATLWHALQVDPNQDNGMDWYVATQRERSGESAAGQALQRIASLPGSWLAQIRLARAALTANDLEKALACYRESLARLGNNVPPDPLMQISGDLGNHGHLTELLELTEPHFVPEVHGLQVGNNLIKAHLDLGQLDDARRILDQLYALKRPDWQETLSYWDTEIARARLANSKVQIQEPLSIAMLSIEGPVWLKPDSPAARLFPSSPTSAQPITFLGSSATVATPSTEIERQMSDAPGRMSRALPLFLAEQMKFACEANVQTLIPWIVEASGSGFVLSGVAWSDEDALGYVRQGDTQSPYVVITHLNTQSDRWTVNLRVLRAAGGECIGKLETSFALSAPQDGLIDLSHKLAGLLEKEAGIKTRSVATLYQLPHPSHLGNYLLRLEQLLAVRCASMDGVSPAFLNGEREIVGGNLQLSLSCPDNVALRILLAQTLLSMNKVKPNVVKEFGERVGMLQNEVPLEEPAQSVVQELLSEIEF